jgi:hypothetical protein
MNPSLCPSPGAPSPARILLVGVALLAWALPAHAQPWDCGSERMNRELDFWIGDWDVYADGELAGRNRIEPSLDGCVLIERWTSAAGASGVSLNWVDRSTGSTPRWRQLWVDQHGMTLDYTHGEYAEGAMRFQGHTVGEDGERVVQRLTLIQVAPDTVRQQFASSTDGGENWESGWEGLYVRRGSMQPVGDGDEAGSFDAAPDYRDADEVLELARKRHDPDGRWDSTELAVHIQEPRRSWR